MMVLSADILVKLEKSYEKRLISCYHGMVALCFFKETCNICDFRYLLVDTLIVSQNYFTTAI